MITVRRLPHNGALELSAMVRDTAGWGVWLEHTTYYGYDKTEAKRRFREHLIHNHYVLVNDQVMEVTTMKYTATVTFDVLDFEADSVKDADSKIDKLIDLLSDASEAWDSLNWDNVEWKAEVAQ